MSGINQSLKEKILSKHGNVPETDLAIQALELAEQHKDDPDVIKHKIEVHINTLVKKAGQKESKK